MRKVYLTHPWAEEIKKKLNREKVYIFDVKDGWVRYQWESWYCPGTYIGYPVRTVGEFLSLYEPERE